MVKKISAVNLFKKDSFIISLIFLVAFSLMATNFIVAQEEGDSADNSESIYVSGIELEKESVAIGGEVSGSFSLDNVGESVVSAVQYKVELVNIFEETLTYENEDSTTEELASDQISAPFASSDLSSAVTVNPGSTILPFKYKIPTKVPEGRIGLVISAHSANELLLGYDFVELNLTGERIKYAAILTNISIVDKDAFKETFGPLEGPRIGKEDSVSLDVELFSGEDASINLVPQVKIYAGNDIYGEEVYSNKFNQITLVSGEQNFSYKLPIDFDSGVYTGTIEYVDGNGVSKTIASEFRYIIDNNGLKAKLGEIKYNTTNLVNENLLVSISYLDTPLSFRKNADGTYKDPRVQKFTELNKNFDPENLPTTENELFLVSPQNFLEGMTAEVRVTDMSTNSVIAREHVQFENSAATVADLGKLTGVKQVMVEVDLYQNGEKIDSYVDFTEFETYQYKNIFDKLWYKYKTLTSVAVLVILLVLIALGVKFSKVSKNVGGSALIAVLMVGASFAFIQNTDDAQAYSLDENFVTRAKIQSPKPPNVTAYEPGENIRFIADMDFMYCTNSGYNLKARVTRPVMAGRPHTAFGPWFNLPKGKFIQTMYNYSPLGRYDTGINIPIKAPNKPDVYVFKYEVVGVSGDWGDQEQGVVRFKVAKDLCANIRGVQERVPANHITSINAQRKPICTPRRPITNSTSLRCTASKNRVEVGEPVTYEAERVDAKPGNFLWYEGFHDSGDAPVKTQNNVRISQYTTSYDEPGSYLVSVVSRVAPGVEDVCRIGVAVGDAELIEPTEDNLDDFVDRTQFYTDEDGNRFPLDPNAGPGRITFTMDKTLTNTTCKGTWEAENVLKCGLYRNNVKVEDVNFSGEKDMNPGTYQIKCIQTNNGAEISSETRSCRLNPDFRES